MPVHPRRTLHYGSADQARTAARQGRGAASGPRTLASAYAHGQIAVEQLRHHPIPVPRARSLLGDTAGWWPRAATGYACGMRTTLYRTAAGPVGSRCGRTRSSTWPRPRRSCSLLLVVSSRSARRGRPGREPSRRTCWEFARTARARSPSAQPLTQTTGLRPDLPFWRDWQGPGRAVAACRGVALTRRATTYESSTDLNLLDEAVHPGRRYRADLDELYARRSTATLGLPRRPTTRRSRMKQRVGRRSTSTCRRRSWTAVSSARCTTRNAWRCGVAGRRGRLSTARDMESWRKAMLNGGTYDERSRVQPSR